MQFEAETTQTSRSEALLDHLKGSHFLSYKKDGLSLVHRSSNQVRDCL
jgi:hypothetical protein